MPPCGDTNTAIIKQSENPFCGDDRIPRLRPRLHQLPFGPCHQIFEHQLQGLLGPDRDIFLQELLEHHSPLDIVIHLTSRLENIITACQERQVNSRILSHNHSGGCLPHPGPSSTNSRHHTDLSISSESDSCFPHRLSSHIQNVISQNGMDANEQNFQGDDEFCENDSGFGSSGGVICRRQEVYDCNRDIENLDRNARELSDSHFYYGNIDSQRAKDLLHKKPPGTFLIRDSSDSRYLYSLSVNTRRGATSVRILYSNGLFQFDSDEKIRDKLPQFESVLELVDFHVRVTQDGGNKSWRWEELSGKKSMMVMLTKPLLNSVPSLAHLARVKTNKCLEDVHLPAVSVDRLPIHPNLKEYLKQYPYQI